MRPWTNTYAGVSFRVGFRVGLKVERRNVYQCTRTFTDDVLYEIQYLGPALAGRFLWYKEERWSASGCSSQQIQHLNPLHPEIFFFHHDEYLNSHQNVVPIPRRPRHGRQQQR
jgi:hypothetical protein